MPSKEKAELAFLKFSNKQNGIAEKKIATNKTKQLN
jgi:hypothetical protein